MYSLKDIDNFIEKEKTLEQGIFLTDRIMSVVEGTNYDLMHNSFKISLRQSLSFAATIIIVIMIGIGIGSKYKSSINGNAISINDNQLEHLYFYTEIKDKGHE